MNLRLDYFNEGRKLRYRVTHLFLVTNFRQITQTSIRPRPYREYLTYTNRADMGNNFLIFGMTRG